LPPLDEHHSANSIKLLLIGDSGNGKTGSLASLASAGYNLRIIDLDNGLDVLKAYLTDSRSIYQKGSAKRVNYVTYTEEMRNMGGRMIPKSAKVWSNTMNQLMNWRDGDLSLGPVSSWGERDILVIDSLTFLSNAAMKFTLALNGRLHEKPHQSDWGIAQGLVEGLLEMLYSTDIKCHVIVLCHITFIGEENGPTRGYPNTLGKALPPKVARYFNSTLMAVSSGQGANEKRKIKTNTTGVIALKNSNPLNVQAEYPLETGLADFFRALRGDLKPEAEVKA